MKSSRLITILLILLFFTNCEKNRNSICNNNNYSCLHVTDYNGNSLGSCEELVQWQTDYVLGANDKSLFQDKEELTLEGLNESEITNILFYPNPFANEGRLFIEVDNPSVLHMAVIDDQCMIVDDFIFEANLNAGDNNFAIDMLGVSNGNYRLVYSLSKENEHHYVGGFGNIKKE